MSRSIVCGIDNSIQARRAAELTLRLARAFDAVPILVHAVGGDPKLPVEVAAGAEAEERIVSDRPERALARVASETDAMLVAVGSRGRGRLRSALLGSTSRATIRAVDCPVVVVPPGAAELGTPGNAIVCGVNGSTASDYALAAAVELSDRLDRELTLVSVQGAASLAAIPAAGVAPPVDYLAMRGRQEAEEALERATTGLGGRMGARRRINVGDVAGQIVATAEEEGAELIVIGASEAGAVEDIVLGSISTILCRRASSPVVVVPEGASLSG